MRFTSEEAFDDESITMTRGAAERTLRDHSADLSEFLADFGDRSIYPAHEVLGWLGY